MIIRRVLLLKFEHWSAGKRLREGESDNGLAIGQCEEQKKSKLSSFQKTGRTDIQFSDKFVLIAMRYCCLSYYMLIFELIKHLNSKICGLPWRPTLTHIDAILLKGRKLSRKA